MNIDLHGTPFSRNGSFLAFSILPESERRPAGLYLRSVHGGAQAVQPGGRLALVEVVHDGQVLPYEALATPARLELRTERGSLLFCFPDAYTLRVRGEGVGLRLTFDPALGDFSIPTGDGRLRVNSMAYLLQLMLSPLTGVWRADGAWNGTGAAPVIASLLPEEGETQCEGLVEEYASSWRPGIIEMTFEEDVAQVEADFQQWLEQAPALPARYQEAAALAAYVNWSSVVEPEGHLLRPAMLMSKNWMTNIWAWDHCFNAMALIYRRPVTGWDQLMTLFDQQDEHGALPDFVNDRGLLWNFCKPPIHGWALGWMMLRTGFVRTDQVRQIYGPLCRWTEWWFRFRDDDGDGLPQYHHGNDSGWDNATPFLTGVPLESPDLCAFLILQMETLANLAAHLNLMEEAESWQRRSEELQEMMMAHFWQGDHFVALRSGDHEVADSESLFLYLPLILGKRLPAAVRSELISGLTRSGRFLTRYGLATESLKSPYYEPDGYWRGPIWAPSTMLLVEGLAACGELDQARDIARRFCDMVARAGFAENFDAKTGQPLRDLSYTWTASVFLVLAHEYLLES